MNGRRLAVAAAWGCAALAVVGFFQPWVYLDVREPSLVRQLRTTAPVQGALRGLTKDVSRITATIQRGAKTISANIPLGSLNDIPRQLSGAQIPQLANSDQAQLGLAVMAIITGKSQDVGRQSYAVYALPLLALLAAAVVTAMARPLAAWIVAGVCAAVGLGGLIKLATTPLASPILAVTIGPGLWMSLWAYVGLAAAAAVSALMRSRRRAV